MKHHKMTTNSSHMLSITGRRMWDLSDCVEVFKGVFHLRKNQYILVKDNEHYHILKERLDRLVAQSRGHTDEIVRDFKPRKRRKSGEHRDKKTIEKIKKRGLMSSTVRWIKPELNDDIKTYDKDGFIRRDKMTV